MYYGAMLHAVMKLKSNPGDQEQRTNKVLEARIIIFESNKHYSITDLMPWPMHVFFYHSCL